MPRTVLYNCGPSRFYNRLTPSVAKSCYLARIQAFVAAQWFDSEDFRDINTSAGQARVTVEMLAWDWYRSIKKTGWVTNDYVFVAKPIWDATSYMVDVGLTDQGERALLAIQQGYVWVHSDLGGSKGIDISETLRYWRSQIRTISEHDDPLIKQITSISDNPEMKPLLAEIMMQKMLLD